MRFAFVSILSLLFVFSLLSCTRSGAKSDPIEQDPVNISGKNIHNLTPTCTAAKSETLRQEISCRVAIKLPAGETVLAKKQADLAIDWQTPSLISGSPFNLLSQNVSLDGLQFDAVLELEQSLGTQLQFGFQSALTSGPSATASQTVTVPFSVTTYGFTPQLRDAFILNAQAPGTVGASVLGKSAAALTSANEIPGQFLPQSFPIAQALFNFTPLQTSSLCSIRDKLFFASSESIYVIQNNRVRLFAGNRTPGLLPAKETYFTDPFGVELGKFPGIACKEGALEADDRIFAVSTTIRTSTRENPLRYPLLIAEFRMDGSGVLKRLTETAVGISGIALSPRGELFILDFSVNAVTLFKVSAAGVITAIPVQTPPEITNRPSRIDQGGIAVDADGTVYLAIPQAHSLFALKNGSSTLTRIAGTGNVRSGTAIDYTKPAADIALNAPQGIVLLSPGKIIFAEKNSSRLFRLDVTQQKLSLFLGEGTSPLPPDQNEENAFDGTKLRHALPMPLQLSRAKDKLWITLAAANTVDQADSIVRVTLGANDVPQKLSRQSGGNYAHLQDGDDFRTMTSLSAMDSNQLGTHKKITGIRYLRNHGDDFCILDGTHGRLYCVGKDGLVRTLAGGVGKSRAANYSFANPVSAFAYSLDRPEAFAFGPDGSIFISLYYHRVILKVTPEGSLLTVAGVDNAFESPDATILNAHPELLIGPTALDVDNAGNVYFIDRINQANFRGTYIKKLTPQPNGTYTVTRLAGATVNGPIETSPFVLFEEGTNVVNSPLLPAYDLRVAGPNQLYLAVRAASISGYLNRTAASSGAIFRLGNGSLTLIAGGPRAISDAVSGNSKTIRVSPVYLDVTSSGAIYASDDDQSIRRITPGPEPESFLMENLAAKSLTQGRCGGGVKKGTGEGTETDKLWTATLNTVCIGNPLGIAVRDECSTPGNNGDFSILFAQDFDWGVGNSIVVEARRGCF